ncbi:MAG: hypothetical protein MZV70_02305 [Desulfobacterales bacterium]|nr:hypothetical protein [Desulfobacterales bacterium]
MGSFTTASAYCSHPAWSAGAVRHVQARPSPARPRPTWRTLCCKSESHTEHGSQTRQKDDAGIQQYAQVDGFLRLDPPSDTSLRDEKSLHYLSAGADPR